MIFRTLHSLRDRLVSWTAHKSRSKYALTWLSGISFAESSFFPVPPDILLAPIVVAHREKWVVYGLLTTVASVLGGVFGYLIGALFYDVLGVSIVEWYALQEEFVYVGGLFEAHAFFAMFAAAFTPIPYKVFTIAAGLFSVNIWVFLVASLFGRGLRFLAVSYVMHRYGRGISNIIYKYFNLLTLVVIAAVLFFIVFL